MSQRVRLKASAPSAEEPGGVGLAVVGLAECGEETGE